MKRLLALAALIAAGCGESERNVAAVEPEAPPEMGPSMADDPELANYAAAAEAEDAAVGGMVSTNDVTAANAAD